MIFIKTILYFITSKLKKHYISDPIRIKPTLSSKLAQNFQIKSSARGSSFTKTSKIGYDCFVRDQAFMTCHKEMLFQNNSMKERVNPPASGDATILLSAGNLIEI